MLRPAGETPDETAFDSMLETRPRKWSEVARAMLNDVSLVLTSNSLKTQMVFNAAPMSRKRGFAKILLSPYTRGRGRR